MKFSHLKQKKTKEELRYLNKNFYSDFKISISVKQYREVSRSYLLKVIEKQKEDVETYPISLFNKNLADDLKESGFFDKYKKVLWWRQEVCPKTFRCVYTPIRDGFI